MHNAMNAVLEFHEAVDQPIGDPRNPDVTVDQELRKELIREEFEELKLALDGFDKNGRGLFKHEQIEAVADALGDLCYVICGAAVSWGIDLGPVFDAIHDSNMSKTADGINATNDLKMRAEKRPDGKVLKGPNYRPPDIKGALARSKAEAEETGFGEDCFWPTPSVLRNLPPKRKNPIDLEHIELAPYDAKNLTWELKFAKEHLDATPEELHKIAQEMKEASEPPPVSKELKLAAAMKSIKEDFVPDLKGWFTSYGAYNFNCTKCERLQSVNTKEGTRNGWATKTGCECMCGMHYEIVFVQSKGKDPTVQARATDLGGVAPSGVA